MRRQTVRQKIRRKLMMNHEQESDSALMMPAEPGMASAWSFEYWSRLGIKSQHSVLCKHLYAFLKPCLTFQVWNHALFDDWCPHADRGPRGSCWTRSGCRTDKGRLVLKVTWRSQLLKQSAFNTAGMRAPAVLFSSTDPLLCVV